MICFGCGMKIRWWTKAHVQSGGHKSYLALHPRCNDAFWTGHKLGSDSERGRPRPGNAKAISTLRDIIGAYLTPTSHAEHKALSALRELE